MCHTVTMRTHILLLTVTLLNGKECTVALSKLIVFFIYIRCEKMFHIHIPVFFNEHANYLVV